MLKLSFINSTFPSSIFFNCIHSVRHDFPARHRIFPSAMEPFSFASSDALDYPVSIRM
jgi:hypothetical protein